jgi:hypothetical protein
MAKGFAKPQNVGKTFSRLLSYLKPHAGKLILAALLLLVSSLGGVVGTAYHDGTKLMRKN